MDTEQQGEKIGRVNGIQHLGIGSSNLLKTWEWCRDMFGMDIPMFDSVAEAPLMDIYTRNKTVNKRAAMVYNVQGGGAIEIVELRSVKTTNPEFEVFLGDLGIFAAKIKTTPANFDAAVREIKMHAGEGNSSDIERDPAGRKTFKLSGPNGLYYELIEGDAFFTKGRYLTGGTAGCIIGCSDIEESIRFYGELGYSELVYKVEGKFEDFSFFPGGEHTFKRCLLKQKRPVSGNFSEFIGETCIELVQVMDREPKKIYENRIWGDIGFVHLGFDVKNMDELEKRLGKSGYHFTCDSSSGLHMGKTRVHCTYIEDPDGALIELIEVYKMPIIEKWGLFMDLKKRSPFKPVPSWLLKLARFTRVKDDYFVKAIK